MYSKNCSKINEYHPNCVALSIYALKTKETNLRPDEEPKRAAGLAAGDLFCSLF